MISDTEYAQAVSQFLSKKGVTRCPTACVVPTRASVSDADRAALRDHAETQEAVRQARRREFHQLISPQSTSRDRYANSANPLVSDPHNKACVSP
jgi:hypothetical protein